MPLKTLSVRALSVQLDISQSTVLEILRKDLKMFPYKAETTTSLLPRHKLDRVEFCRWLRRAHACFEAEGGHFKHKLKKKK